MESPFVTLKLQVKKKFNEDKIVWEKPISSELLSNNFWFIKISAISFYNVKHLNNQKITEENKSKCFNFSLKTNLTRQNYLWYSKLVNLDDEEDNLPIEIFSLKLQDLKNDFTHLNFSNICHPVTCINNTLSIACENLSQSKYKLENFEFDTIILVNVFKIS